MTNAPFCIWNIFNLYLFCVLWSQVSEQALQSKYKPVCFSAVQEGFFSLQIPSHCLPAIPSEPELLMKELPESFNTLLSEGSALSPYTRETAPRYPLPDALYTGTLRTLISCFWESQKITNPFLYPFLLALLHFICFSLRNEFIGIMLTSQGCKKDPLGLAGPSGQEVPLWKSSRRPYITTTPLQCQAINGNTIISIKYVQSYDVLSAGATALMRCHWQTTRSCHKALTHWFSEAGVSSCISNETKGLGILPVHLWAVGYGVKSLRTCAVSFQPCKLPKALVK